MFYQNLAGILILLSLAPKIEADDSTGVNYISTKISTPGTLENGRNKLEEMKMRMNMPQYGECWTSALSDLEVACKIMDATIQSKLAFAFTSCFVEMLGFPPYLCDKGGHIQECIKNLDQRGYNTFLEYFLHTQDMCFFLTSQLWQEETDKTVNRLAFAAAGVSDSLEDTKKTQDEILKSQQEALKVQSNIMKDNNALYNAIVTFKQIFDDLTLRADEHKQIFREIFEQLNIVQQVVSWIQSEMSLLDTIGFYFLSLILAFVFTSSERTRGARSFLVMFYPTIFALERLLYNYWVAPDQGLAPEEIQIRLWWYRKCALCMGMLSILHCAYSYCNYETINNRLIQETNKQIQDMKIMVNRSLNCIMDRLEIDENATTQDDSLTDDGTDSDDSESSNYSKDSDTLSTNSSLSTNLAEIDAVEKDSLIAEGRQMFPESDKENKPVNPRVLNIIDEDMPVGPPMLSSTPIVRSPNSPSHRYNLRERLSSPSNPVLKTESPKDFVKKMKNLQKKSHTDSFYSSDDDF